MSVCLSVKIKTLHWVLVSESQIAVECKGLMPVFHWSLCALGSLFNIVSLSYIQKKEVVLKIEITFKILILQ